ncbi:uncharacterized protein LOC141613124 [Silene latifolia]|uniref:uncharacterized protein LOC141613124 n=1 Tax=Silene latifolia TaxID=37657 RepID=UPI003D782604
MGPQRRLGIYVGFISPSIIKYLEPMTGDLFTARFADCHFDEHTFPVLGGERKVDQRPKEITWNADSLLYPDPRNGSCKQEVQKIIHLQSVANQLPDAFTNSKGVTKSHIPAVNAPARIDIPIENSDKSIAEQSMARRKRGRPPGSKDLKPRKSKKQKEISCDKDSEEETLLGYRERKLWKM